ncbi:MAG: Grx4 family monothiol glutaredoxin [Deltaproteobacteria bacterium]|nr:Grx4 family monothiol glutaredoxin [Deltaproteobacteria bacterium]
MPQPLDEDLKKRIQDVIAQHEVVLFMKGNKHIPQCGFSAAVVQILKSLEVGFETVNVLADPALREGIKAFSEWPTIPQLYIRGEFVGGSDIVREMHASGELHDLLGVQPKVVAPPTITVTDAAFAAFRGASGDADADDALRLAIDARFQNDLFFGPKTADDLVVTTANGVTIAMDPATAARANGLVIDFVQTPAGMGFKIDNPNAPPAVRVLRVEELRSQLQRGEELHLVDVRTEEEQAIARVPGFRLLDQPYARELEALPKGAKLVFMCHHGVRSMAAAERFLERGYTNVWNVAGGIDAWSAIDPSVRRY